MLGDWGGFSQITLFQDLLCSPGERVKIALSPSGNTVTNKNAFRVVLGEPGFRGIQVGEYLEMLNVADLLPRVDVDKTVVGLSSAFWLLPKAIWLGGQA